MSERNYQSPPQSPLTRRPTISDEKRVESLASKEPVNEAGLLTRQEEKASAPENKPPVNTAEGQIAETKKEPGTIRSTIEEPSEPVLTSGVTKEKEIPGAVTPAKDEKKPPEYNPDETFPTEEKETAAEGVTLSYATDLKNWLAERSLTVTQRSDSKAQRYYKKGASYQKQGKLNQAIESYSRALTFNPDHAQAQLNLATTYLQLGRFKDAEQKLIYLYALKPNDCKILFNFGLLLYQTGDLPSAEVKLKRLLELDPYHLEGNLLLGSVYEQRGKIKKAVESFIKAYHINSGDPGVLYRLGRAWDLAGKPSKAVEFYRLFLSAPLQKKSELKETVVDRLNYLVSQEEGK
jgi:Flp pilus assembly protein TadD